ncbi:Fe-S cluster assembly protein SufB [Candidatus Roizmanbacteria bacterium CG10_big_fil_rev_8_21_14_0_10_45_7]|uniref:Fe-S cluster assembly protein SufB n=1 Tax=Candidatus Roizmanbacteria bacterium CG10_big_fil_rev_8_21_14_0_10_45_7 TaxID=1974854 RepID=A0A2M8KVP6_9BACT|nr:MAG: Fe-S cluster assembly protein SufB [Candidatus Roizmanbacteria bacterium CG10_big_fil_rev_8_21_14_0_10_45_7]
MGADSHISQWDMRSDSAYAFKAKPGLSERVIRELSAYKQEPSWMLERRLAAYSIFQKKSLPAWGGDLSRIDFESIHYYVRPEAKKANSWNELPADIKKTYDYLGIPEAEKKYLSGVSAQYESEVLYKSIHSELSKLGVVFLDTDSGLREYPELFKAYFGTLIPAADNKFAALNTAFWSGGSFVYIPKGVTIPMPLQAYFRINTQNMGQFERTLIIAEEASSVHYIEGCSAPTYTTSSLHSAVVEIFVKEEAKVRYTTVQNWSPNVYNLVTKRARVEKQATMQWIDGNLGCLAGDTKVYEKNKGLMNVVDIRAGDKLYGLDPKTYCIKAFPVKATRVTGTRSVYELVTQNFRSIKATDNHPFLVLSKERYASSYIMHWKELKNIHIGDYVAVAQSLPDEGKPYSIEYRHQYKNLKHHPILPQETNNDFMWLLGLYLGDGFVDRNRAGHPNRVYLAIPPKDKSRKRLIQVIDKLFHIPYSEKGISVTINSVVIASLLMKLDFDGTAKDKHIPQWIWTLPIEQRLAFIEGYLDADGYIRNHKTIQGREYGQITFSSSNKALLLQCKYLLISCGLDPLKISTYVKERKLYKGKLKTYISHFLVLKAKKSLDIIKNKYIQQPIGTFVQVKAVIPQEKEKVYDLEVEGAENFIANGIIVHNSKLTMKYPSCYLMGEGARGEVLSIAYAGALQHQDAGAKMMHFAPYTTSRIVSKSIAKDAGRTSYRGLVYIKRGAHHTKTKVVCDALLLDAQSRSDTYPTMKIDEQHTQVEHEAVVSKIGDEQLFYLMSRGVTKERAEALIVNGFLDSVVRELPLEYAVELNRLIALEMEGSIG